MGTGTAALQRSAPPAQGSRATPSVVRAPLAAHANVHAPAPGLGAPLQAAERSYFEPRLGADFSGVRVYTGPEASAEAHRLNALAFTRGDHIGFAAGAYQPGRPGGRRLLAHELAHVVQQRLGQAGTQLCGDGCSCSHDEAETEADEVAQEVASGAAVRPGALSAAAPGSVQRQANPTGTGAATPAAGGAAATGPAAGPARAQAGAHPCGGSSLASSFTPTDQGLSVTMGATDFGDTVRDRAAPEFGACKVGRQWRFFLRSLVVRIASAVKPIDYRINVANANDASVTASSWPQVVRDLDPARTGSFTVTCAGVRYVDSVSGYSLRRQFWNRGFVVDHEAFHRQDWTGYYRPELRRSEQEIWAYSLPETTGPDAAAAVTRAVMPLRTMVDDAYTRASAAYCPQKETRAYAHGLFDYLRLTEAVRQRARVEHWPGAPAPSIQDLGPGDFPTGTGRPGVAIG